MALVGASAGAWLPRGSGLGAATSGAGGAESPRSGSAARPNVLFIMSDDCAAHAVSCYGSKINKTPNVDRMALEGIRFASCFAVNSICTPSRAAILTGKQSRMKGQSDTFQEASAGSPSAATPSTESSSSWT